jgi:hypothetical protein
VFSQKQVRAIAQELRDRLIKCIVTDHELVVALLAMEKAYLVTTENVADILLYVYFGSREGALRALDKAKPFKMTLSLMLWQQKLVI